MVLPQRPGIAQLLHLRLWHQSLQGWACLISERGTRDGMGQQLLCVIEMYGGVSMMGNIFAFFAFCFLGVAQLTSLDDIGWRWTAFALIGKCWNGGGGLEPWGSCDVMGKKVGGVWEEKGVQWEEIGVIRS